MLCFTVQQLTEVNLLTLHTSIGQNQLSFQKNATAPAVCFRVVFSPYSRATAERDLLSMGVELMVSKVGIR